MVFEGLSIFCEDGARCFQVLYKRTSGSLFVHDVNTDDSEFIFWNELTVCDVAPE